MYDINVARRVAAATVVVALLSCVHATYAGFLKFNTDFTNTTGSIVNDYHVRLEANVPITVSSTWETGGDVQFAPGVVTGNGTQSVQVDWAGATVNQGQTTHVGVSTSTYIPSLRIVESWWTIGGVKFTLNPNDGVNASADFDGGAAFTVVKALLYDDINGSNLIGTEWIEGPGTLTGISNETADGPIFVAFSTLSSPTEIALQDLNATLGGFGPPGPITLYPPLVPIPTSSEWGLLVVALLMLTGGAIVIGRRRRSAAA